MIDIEKTVAQWAKAGDILDEDIAPIAALLKATAKTMPAEAVPGLCEQYLKSWCKLRANPALFRKRKRQLERARRRLKLSHLFCLTFLSL
jgi:hypothetical protein